MTKVKVDHTGICMNHHFLKDQVVDLPDEAIVALGTHAKIVNEGTEVKPETIKRVLKTKQIKKVPYHEAILGGKNRGPQVITKDEEN